MIYPVIFLCTQANTIHLASAAITKITPIVIAELTNKALENLSITLKIEPTYEECLHNCHQAYPRLHPRPAGKIPLGECIQHCWNRFAPKDSNSP